MGHTLAEQQFTSYAKVENWVPNWFASKDENIYGGIQKLPESWRKCVTSDGEYFE